MDCAEMSIHHTTDQQDRQPGRASPLASCTPLQGRGSPATQPPFWSHRAEL